jgi:hypothetical protein
MKLADLIPILKRLIAAYPTLPEPPRTTAEVWLATLERSGVGVEALNRAVAIIHEEVDTIYPSTNLAALLIRTAKPKITEATVMEHLSKAHSSMGAADAHGYLSGIDPILLEIAENGGLFNRQLSEEGVRFLTRDLARQYLERKENAKRGYRQAEPVPVERRLTGPAPAPTQISGATRAALADFRARLGWEGGEANG